MAAHRAAIEREYNRKENIKDADRRQDVANEKDTVARRKRRAELRERLRIT